jgi:hypothetical protein
MQLRARAASLTAVALLLSAGGAVADPPNFDFNGYAQVPAGIGGTLTVRSVLTNNGVVPTPIPLNFALNQYTLVVTGTLASSAGIAQQYNPASVSMYEDPIGGGTAADYAVPGTFTDGTLILGGSFNGNLTRNTFTPNLGNYVGKIDFSSGSLLALLPTPNGWPFGGGWSRTISGIPPGYQENWDGKIDLAAVGVQQKTWSGVKGLFK